MEQYAYIRVSSKDQHIDRQLEAIKQLEIPPKNIFCDYQSGKDFKRPAYSKLKKKLKKGDLVIIKSIDRLGRNYREILAEWNDITNMIGADIKVLDMSLLDTTKSEGSLTGRLISDLVLQILAYVAQSEREMIHQRQAEGIAAAKNKGVVFGRKRKEVPENFEMIIKQIQNKELTYEEVSKKTGLSKSTIIRRMKEFSREKCKNVDFLARHYLL